METSGERLRSPERDREIAVIEGPQWLGLVCAQLHLCLRAPGLRVAGADLPGAAWHLLQFALADLWEVGYFLW